jgi:hypothetical protein
MNSIAETASTYETSHDLNQVSKNFSLNPKLIAIITKDIMTVVIMPIMRAKSIFCFIFIPFNLILGKKAYHVESQIYFSNHPLVKCPIDRTDSFVFKAAIFEAEIVYTR